MHRYFDCIDICKVRCSGWNEVRLRGTLPPLASLDHLSCVLLTVLEPTEAEFTLFQEGQRYDPEPLNMLNDCCNGCILNTVAIAFCDQFSCGSASPSILQTLEEFQSFKYKISSGSSCPFMALCSYSTQVRVTLCNYLIKQTII